MHARWGTIMLLLCTRIVCRNSGRDFLDPWVTKKQGVEGNEVKRHLTSIKSVVKSSHRKPRSSCMCYIDNIIVVTYANVDEVCISSLFEFSFNHLLLGTQFNVIDAYIMTSK